MADTDKIEALWQEYLEAATPCADNESGFDLYSIEDMKDAAHALYEAAMALALGLPVVRDE